MPDEKIDQKRPAHAESELKKMQQRLVDDTVDDSFPASDPPAWTTSGAKSVAAQCDTDAPDEALKPLDQGLQGNAGSPAQRMADQASSLARDLYRRGQDYIEEGRQRVPEARRYYRQGTQAASRPVQEHPLTAVLVAGAIGYALGWLLSSRSGGANSGRQWRPGYNRHPSTSQESQAGPHAPDQGRSGQFPARAGLDAAGQVNDSL